MEAGQFKIGAIIQARLGSTRLPNKVLMPLGIGFQNTVISQIINSLKKSEFISDIVVATTESAINDRLVAYINDLNIKCFRGSEEDVLSRFYHVAIENDFDYVLRLTADNPIIDIKCLEDFIENFLTKNLDYSSSESLPLGCNFEVMKASAIIAAFQNSSSKYDSEHVTPYIKREIGNQEVYNFGNTYSGLKDVRLTIDYPTDYALLHLIFSYLNGEEKTLANVLRVVEENPWLRDVNKDNFQKIEFNSLSEEVINLIPVLKEREMNRVEKILTGVISKI